MKVVEVIFEVNLWVEKQISGFIKEVLFFGLVDNIIRFIFVNVLYFKGVWQEKFNVLSIKESDFYFFNGGLVKVRFMIIKQKQLIKVFDGFKVFGLFYK